MIYELYKYYQALVKLGKIDPVGWNKIGVSYAIEIDRDGNLKFIHSLKQEVPLKKKTVFVPAQMTLPARCSKSSNIKSNFLWGSADYMLGLPKNDKTERAVKCFEAARDLHLSLIGNVDSVCAKAVCNYFKHWDPTKAEALLKDNEAFDDMQAGANLVFLVDDVYPQTDPLIETAWQNHYDAVPEADESEMSRDLITGELVVPAKTHPLVTGVRGGQSSGMALSSFNAPSFCSYGHKQNENAPIGKFNAFAYASALDYLYKNEMNHKYIDDTAVLYWAESGEDEYQDAFASLIDSSNGTITDKDLNDIMEKLSKGISVQWDSVSLNPDTKFYVATVDPNASRFVVKSFYENSFGKIVDSVYRHAKGLELIPCQKQDFLTIPLWKLINATVNIKSKSDKPLPKMMSETFKAIVSGGKYPVTLYQRLMSRIDAEQHRPCTSRDEKDRLWTQLSGVKAYLLRNGTSKKMKEAMTVMLNEETTYQPYVLGRLFAILERIQETAMPGINTTIKNRFFASAEKTPSRVFPHLIDLSNHHQDKLDDKDKGKKIHLQKLLGEVMGKVEGCFPNRLSVQDQGVFQLGYYHQRQKFFETKPSPVKDETPEPESMTISKEE